MFLRTSPVITFIAVATASAFVLFVILGGISRFRVNGADSGGEWPPGSKSNTVPLAPRPITGKQGSTAGTGVTNATLGFEKVFVLNLEERTDKRDSLALASGLTGIKLEFVKGLRGAAVVDKALPYGVDRKTMDAGMLGSWRGHMNIVRTIVEEGLSSALIMEDDIDWDVNLKAQLLQFAEGSNYILNTPSKGQPHSPYGDSWDLLWLGSCNSQFQEDVSPKIEGPDLRKWAIKDDPTVPDLTHIGRSDKGDGSVNYTDYPEHTRFVHRTGTGICSFVYALSAAGARKFLYSMSVNGLWGTYDNQMSQMCTKQSLGMQCVHVSPPLFFSHRPKGRTGGDSDINNPEDFIREKPETQNIVFSTKINAERLIMGLDPLPQW
ncbi:MAG: hypothetical protein M1812_000929 [Candelaria pacifica]|nr:MAG: hypothetical protein M1812_000929 [Candelaria pacifica]